MKQRAFLQVGLQILETLELSFLSYFPYGRFLKSLKILTQGDETIQRQVGKASQALTYATEVTTNVQKTLEVQKQQLEKVVSDYRKYAALAATEKEKAQAWLKEIRRTSRRDRIIQGIVALLISGGFFALGYYLG